MRSKEPSSCATATPSRPRRGSTLWGITSSTTFLQRYADKRRRARKILSVCRKACENCSASSARPRHCADTSPLLEIASRCVWEQTRIASISCSKRYRSGPQKTIKQKGPFANAQTRGFNGRRESRAAGVRAPWAALACAQSTHQRRQPAPRDQEIHHRS